MPTIIEFKQIKTEKGRIILSTLCPKISRVLVGSLFCQVCEHNVNKKIVNSSVYCSFGD